MLREATSEDIPEMFELHKQFIRKMTKLRPNRYKLHQDEQEVFKKEILKKIKTPDAKVVVYEKQGAIVGFGVGEIEDNPSFCKHRKYGNAHYAVVKEGFQNQGIGSEILKDRIKFFKSRGIKQVESTIDMENKQSIDYMKKNGFSPELNTVIKDV